MNKNIRNDRIDMFTKILIKISSVIKKLLIDPIDALMYQGQTF